MESFEISNPAKQLTHNTAYITISYAVLGCRKCQCHCFYCQSISSHNSKDSTVAALSLFLWALAKIRLSNLMPQIKYQKIKISIKSKCFMINHSQKLLNHSHKMLKSEFKSQYLISLHRK